MHALIVVATLCVCLLAFLLLLPALSPATLFRLRPPGGGCLAVGACDSTRGGCALLVAPCDSRNPAQAWRATARGLECPARRVLVEGHHAGAAGVTHVDRHRARASTVVLQGPGDTVTVWHEPALGARAAIGGAAIPAGAFLVAGAGGTTTSVYWSESPSPRAPPAAAVLTMERLE